MFQDPDFLQQWTDRWQTLRDGQFSNNVLLTRLDNLEAEIGPAGTRNHQEWGWGSFSGDINTMQTWLRTRADWIDTQWTARPEFALSSRRIDPGFEVVITESEGTTYYTMDGSDPRASGGGIAPGATAYTEPVTLTETALFVARARSGSDWSGPATRSYWTELPTIVISEIMYHPQDGGPRQCVQ